MKIYLVLESDIEGSSIYEAFTKKENANKFIAEVRRIEKGREVYIHEMETDPDFTFLNGNMHYFKPFVNKDF